MRPVKTGGTTDTTRKTPFARTAKPVTGNRPRKGTFVGPDEVAGKAGKSMTGSANEVIRTKLAFTVGAPKVGTSRTVFFKRHGAEAPSQYAVASTRLARFVGMPTIIAHNAFARIHGAGGVVSGKVTGNPLMGAEFLREVTPPPAFTDDDAIAQWAQAVRVVKRDGKYFDRSANVFQPVDFKDPGVQKGMSDLQLFDALTGQTDRHGGNIYIDPVTGAVTGIDDDWSFGVGQPADDVFGNKPKGKYHGLPERVAESTAEMILSLDPDDLPDELAPRKNDTEKLSAKDIADARLRLVTVQAYLQDTGKLRRVWNEETYQQARALPKRSYLGEQAELLEQALAGLVEAEGTNKEMRYKVADGPVIPEKPMRVNQPERVTPTRPPSPQRTQPTARRNLLARARPEVPMILPPLPPDPGPPRDLVPTRRRAMQPAMGLPPMIRIGDSPRNAATARLRLSGTDPLPGIGDPIEQSPGKETVITLSGGDQEIDPRVLAEIDRLQAEELGPDEDQREGFEKLELSDDDIVDDD